MHNALFQNVIMCTPNRFLTAMLWYIELTFHKRISNRIQSQQTKVKNGKLGQFSVTLTSVSIVTTMFGKHCNPSLDKDQILFLFGSMVSFVIHVTMLVWACPIVEVVNGVGGSFYPVVAKMFYGVQVWRFWG
jgi:hypothetical protein